MSETVEEEADSIAIEIDQPAFDNLLLDRDSALAEFRNRNSDYAFRSVHRADVGQFIEDGWEVTRRGKRQHRLRKLKIHHRALEDRVWCLLYRMGYQDVSADKFVVRFRRTNGSTGTKQIDAFAADSETCVIVECKSKGERGKRSLRQDIQETASLQNYIRSTVHAHYKTRPKLSGFM